MNASCVKHSHRSNKLWRRGAVLFSLLGVTGCSSIGAPSFPLVGAYFPDWLICVFFGGVGAAVLRVVFITLGVDAKLRFHLVTYLSLGSLIGLLGWLLLFGW